MSVTRSEFERGLRRLTGAPPRRTVTGDYVIEPHGDRFAIVRCAFEPLPDARLGGVLAVPRVRVSLDLAALSGAARAAFLAKFDRTFQRGGG